jgi:hypothetical protein
MVMPAHKLKQLVLMVDGKEVKPQLSPFQCQAENLAAHCVFQVQIEVAAEQRVQLTTRFSIEAEPGAAVSSLYRESMLPEAALDGASDHAHGLDPERHKAVGVTLRSLKGWASLPKEVCITLQGSKLKDWLRDLSPHGWLSTPNGEWQWRWNDENESLALIDIVLEYSDLLSRAREDKIYQALKVSKKKNLQRWLHLATLRRFGNDRKAFSHALEQAFSLASRLFFNIPAQDDARIYLGPELVALARQQGGAVAAKEKARQVGNHLRNIYDALLLDGKDTTPAAMAIEIVEQLGKKQNFKMNCNIREQ